MNLVKAKNEMSPVLFVRALYDFETNDASNLSFKTNDIIRVLMQLESGWWDGLCNGERGWFPSNYVTAFDKEGRLLNEDEKLYDWILQQTSDGEIFYYNIKTGESSWEVPADSESPAARDITSSFSIHLPENWIQNPTKDEGDLEKFDPADEAFITNSKSSTASNDIQQGGLQSIDNILPNWDVKTTDQEIVYYCNRLTNETAWSLDNVNANGKLIKTENNERSRSDGEMPNEPLPTTSTITIPYKSKRFSGSSIFMLQNANEYLTWDSLSQSIDSSIHDLNVAIQENMKQEYPECTSTIVGNVRIMLYATDTVEKDSVAIKKNKNLKYYHRNIMASLSKLVLSTKVAASAWPPPDAAQIMKSDANEVLGAVRKFIQIAQKTVDIRSVDPKVIESATGGSWHGNNLIQTQPNGNKSRLTPISSNINPENTSTSNSLTNNLSYHLTSDLINLLDKISCTVAQSIISLLNYVRKAIDAPNSSITSSFSSQLISQTKEILAQVGQFLFVTENIDLKDFVESSFSTINEFNVSRQSLYNNIAGLVMCIQMASDPLFPSNAMDKILDCANVVDKSVKDIIIITKSLVIKIQGMRSRRPSTVENFEDSQRNSNNFNSLDQINGNNLEHFAENQSTIPSLDITNISVSKSSQTAPENDIVTNNDPKTSGSNNNDVPINDSITNDSNFSSNNDDVPISPTSPTSASRITGKLQRSYTHPSADNPPTPQVVSGSNTAGAKLQSKIIKDDVSSNATQSQKQKEDKPWFLNYDYDSSEMVFNLENSVKGGTLNALVERLTMHDLLDSNLIATFLLTYRSFCSTDDFFDMLVKRFMIQPPEGLTHEELEVWQEKKQTPVRLRVFNIMKTWLEAYYIDDGEDLRCLEKMREFARTTMYEHMAFASVSLTKVIEKRQQQRKAAKFKELIVTNSLAPPAPILPKNIKKLKFLDIDPLEIARQLTLMESKLYNNIKPVECLGKAWSQSEGDNIAVNVKAMIFNSNKITGWVAESVLNQKEVRKRCMYIKHFVGVADKCRGLNNFNSLTAIISGLYSAPIHRLKRTWEMVNSRTVQTLESLSKIMNSTKNFAEYREMLHSINPPCVPFFGLYLTDLTFIEDGNPDFLKSSNQLINFSKRMKTADVIREIQQYQSVPYNLNPVQEIQTFIDVNLKDSKDVKDLYEQSLSLEPREREDEKIARLLQESGFL